MVNHAVSSRINMERMKQVYEQIPKYRGHSLGYDKYNKRSLMSSTKVQDRSSHINRSPSPTTIIANLNNSGEYMCRTIKTPQNQNILTYQSSSSQPIPMRKNNQHFFNVSEELIGYDENKKNIKLTEENPNSHYNKIIHHRNIQYNQATTNDQFHHRIYDENNETFNEFKVETNDDTYENNYVYGNHYNQSNYDLIESINEESSSMMDTSGADDDCKNNLL